MVINLEIVDLTGVRENGKLFLLVHLWVDVLAWTIQYFDFFIMVKSVVKVWCSNIAYYKNEVYNFISNTLQKS